MLAINGTTNLLELPIDPVVGLRVHDVCDVCT
jgi:hypothetical protein